LDANRPAIDTDRSARRNRHPVIAPQLAGKAVKAEVEVHVLEGTGRR
jgi:hypothetical protein